MSFKYNDTSPAYRRTNDVELKRKWTRTSQEDKEFTTYIPRHHKHTHTHKHHEYKHEKRSFNRRDETTKYEPSRYERPLDDIEKYNNYSVKSDGPSFYNHNKPVNFLTNNYKKLPVIYNVKGFVVNIKGAMNFDIDLDLSSIPEKAREPYTKIYKKSYDYIDYDPETLEETGVKKSHAYRCHIRGIEVKDKNNMNSKIRDYANMEIERLIISENNRWVTCNLYDVDIYSRLLVDVVLYNDTGVIDVATQLLYNYPAVFTEYSSRKEDKPKPVYYGGNDSVVNTQ